MCITVYKYYVSINIKSIIYENIHLPQFMNVGQTLLENLKINIGSNTTSTLTDMIVLLNLIKHSNCKQWNCQILKS